MYGTRAAGARVNSGDARPTEKRPRGSGWAGTDRGKAPFIVTSVELSIAFVYRANIAFAIRVARCSRFSDINLHGLEQ